jgi:uncharacterized membrane protein YgcG
MKRLISLATVLAATAVPAIAHGAATHGVVLSFSARQHKIQLIDSRHLVHGFRYTGALPTLHTGSRVRFHRHGAAIRGVATAGAPARTIRFLGSVVRSSASRLVISLGDGGRITLAPHSVWLMRSIVTDVRHRSSPRVLAFADAAGPSFASGAKVLVTETLTARGQTARIAVKATGGTAGGAGTGGGSGGTGGGGTGGGGTGGGAGGAGGSCTAQTVALDAIGNVTAVSASGITISTTSQGTMSFSLDDPTITDGIVPGDQVDVTYTQQADCSYVASDVEYNELDAVGTVTAVTSGSLTILNQATAQPETFTADPSEQMFQGVSVGDQVDVTYHLSNGQTVVDAVD